MSPEPDFGRLRTRLLRSGVAPRQVHRTLIELNEHFDDLVEAALRDGDDRQAAQRRAVAELGNIDCIAEAVLEHPEFRSWAFRFPRLALVVYPLACLAALPAVPLLAGAANASRLARWAACVLVSGLVTASMFLVLQLSITLT